MIEVDENDKLGTVSLEFEFVRVMLEVLWDPERRSVTPQVSLDKIDIAN